MNTFHLEIITPIRVLDEGIVSYVRCPGMDGSFGIMANHTNAIISLDVGEIKVTHDGKEIYYATSGGFVDVKDNKVQLLVETVERSDEIKKDRAELSAKRAKDRLHAHEQNVDSARANASLLRAVNRIRVSNR